MKKISDKELDRLSRLSSLTFTDKEKIEVKRKLENTLDMLEKCASANTTPLTYNDSIDYVDLREDTIEPSMDRDTLLQNAPKKNKSYFVVPKVVD